MGPRSGQLRASTLSPKTSVSSLAKGEQIIATAEGRCNERLTRKTPSA